MQCNPMQCNGYDLQGAGHVTDGDFIDSYFVLCKAHGAERTTAQIQTETVDTLQGFFSLAFTGFVGL